MVGDAKRLSHHGWEALTCAMLLLFALGKFEIGRSDISGP